jgi:hypothetical protein
MRRRSLAAVAAALAAAAFGAGPGAVQASLDPDSVRAAAAPAFTGRYRLVLVPGKSLLPPSPACSALPTPLSVLMDVTEASIGSRSEVSGQSANPAEPAEDSRFVLLRQGDHLHGGMGTRGAALGLVTVEGYRVWMQLMADGTASTAAGGRSHAFGTAFGEIDVSRPGDADPDSLGYCRALDHTWSLEPA